MQCRLRKPSASPELVFFVWLVGLFTRALLWNFVYRMIDTHSRTESWEKTTATSRHTPARKKKKEKTFAKLKGSINQPTSIKHNSKEFAKQWQKKKRKKNYNCPVSLICPSLKNTCKAVESRTRNHNTCTTLLDLKKTNNDMHSHTRKCTIPFPSRKVHDRSRPIVPLRLMCCPVCSSCPVCPSCPILSCPLRHSTKHYSIKLN